MGAGVLYDSLRPLGQEPTRLLCPWGFPGKITGVGCYFLLQGIFLAQRWNLHLQHWQADTLPLCHLGRRNDCHQFSSVAQSCPTLCDPMNLRLKNELTNFNILLSLPNLYFCHDQQRQPHVLRAKKICHSLKSLHGEKVCFGDTILFLKLITLIYLIILRKKYYRKHHKNLNIIQYPNKGVFNV